MDMPSRPQSDRLVQVSFGVDPQRSDIFHVLMRAAGELRDRDGASDVLVDASCVGDVEDSLDTEFLSWIVLHYERVRLFAIVVEEVACCAVRLRKLEWVSGKPFGIFADEPAAQEWLRSRPWPAEIE
jgi:hypothetical protein